MTGQGITEYRRYDSSYPLMDSSLVGLFGDAVFVLFDTETPLLQTITITDTLVFTMQFDGVNSITFSFDPGICLQDTTLTLRANNRYYGSLVVGPLIEQIASGSLGQLITVNCQFSDNTVRTINSKNGVYGIENLSGTVTVSTSDDMPFTTSPINAINAISLPNKLQTLTTSAQDLYVWDSSNQAMIKLGDTTFTNIVDPTKITGYIANSAVAGISAVVATIDGSGNPMLTGLIYGPNTTAIYNCSVYPWQLLQTVNVTLLDSCALSGSLYGLTSAGIFNFGVYPFTGSAVYPLKITNARHITGVPALSGGYFVVTRPGPQDPNTKTNTSDLFYQVTVSGGSTTATPCGILTYASNFHLPTTTALTVSTSIPGTLQLLAVCGENVYGVALDDQYINAGITTLYSGLGASYPKLSLVEGGWRIIFAPITPLLTINGQPSTSNNIQLLGDDVVMINRTDVNSLTLAVTINDAVLNVTRQTYYG